MFKDLVLKCRTYRRFYEDVAMDTGTLRELVDLARCSASASNRQPLKYIISSSKENNVLIFSCLHWAGALKTWSPTEGEHPTGYIIILGDKEIRESFGVDPGIAAQTILLGAVEKGFGGCMLGNVEKVKLRSLFNIKDSYEIALVVALGKPKEIVKLETMGPADSFNYWRDEKNVHHVPKRKLDDIIVAQL